MHERVDKRVENGRKTTIKLLKIARRMFSKQGYGDTSMEEIVQKAHVTRGALYHHFSGKKGLFLRVFEDALTDVVKRVEKPQGENLDTWEELLLSTHAYLKACIDPELQQIILIDAPAILGWDVWRRVDEEKSLHILKGLLTKLMDEEVIESMPVDALAHIISGAVNESVLWIAQSQDPEQALEEVWSTMKSMMNCLRRPSDLR
jgi:AcrR family transcriptional regulator